jgi:hypothetical protein
MGWIRVVGKSLEFTGKIVASASFEDWALAKGEQVVNEFAQKKTIALFGKRKAAKKELWKNLVDVSQKPALFTVINNLAKNYQTMIVVVADAIEDNKYVANGLTYAIPTTAINSLYRAVVEGTLSKSDEFQELKGGPELRSFFYDEFVAQIDSAFQLLRPSTSEPLRLSGEWYAVGSNADYDWRYPGEAWKGYLFLHGYSGYPADLSKDQTRLKRISDHIGKLELRLGAFSRDEKISFVSNWVAVRDQLRAGQPVKHAPALSVK